MQGDCDTQFARNFTVFGLWLCKVPWIEYSHRVQNNEGSLRLNCILFVHVGTIYNQEIRMKEGRIPDKSGSIRVQLSFSRLEENEKKRDETG